MPYLILVIGLVIGLYALYRFFLNANIEQIKALALALVALIIGIALFFMAITGRLPAAMALFGALIPLLTGLWKMRARKNLEKQDDDDGDDDDGDDDDDLQ